MILGFSLPALLSAPSDVGRVSAAMFTIGYACSVMATIAGGAAWDMVGISRLAFAPIGLCAIVLVGSALIMHRKRELL